MVLLGITDFLPFQGEGYGKLGQIMPDRTLQTRFHLEGA